MEGYLKLCLELVICSLDCRNVAFLILLKYKIYVIYVFHLFSYSFQLPRTTRTHNSVLYPGANQRFSILCWWQRNKSYSRGWISVSLQLKIKKGSIDLKKLCLCTASLVLSTRTNKCPAQAKWPPLDKSLLRHFMAVEGWVWGRREGREAARNTRFPCTLHIEHSTT